MRSLVSARMTSCETGRATDRGLLVGDVRARMELSEKASHAEDHDDGPTSFTTTYLCSANPEC